MSLSLKYRIWLDEEAEVYLGEGRVRLLEAIQELGSINQASKSMGMSSKKAWKLLNSMNTKTPLIETTTGGVRGGGAILTAEGEKAVGLYRDIKARFEELALEENKRIADEA